ncbi:pleiotropic drug resistance ABC transporter [Panus rudis PR-1116 ss-1]|nr:pleiotropic drug resistance ABC transporter [Panus rudis PR-1116 ss-1]
MATESYSDATASGADVTKSTHDPHRIAPLSHNLPATHAAEPEHTRRSVDINFFDPDGVQELRRTLSRTTNEGGDVGVATGQARSSVFTEDTLIADGRFDLEQLARRFVQRFDEAGQKFRELGVMFKDLRVVGVGATAQQQETLGSIINPLFLFRLIQKYRRPALRDILSGFEGVLRPGEMLLVLGRPGAGCSTFLRALTNQREEFYRVDGEVHYDSLTPEEIHKHYRGDVLYCPEDDVHFPTLTVEQTLEFAARTRTPRVRLPGETREQRIKFMIDVVTTVFGLRHVRKTMVGDASIRGVSGGEKKRVSIGEALVTWSKLNAWDNSTRGLDASTALEFVQALRIATDFAHMSTAVAIYQAGESLYKLFDKVCVIYEGKMVHYGPADRARQYFIDMGYQPADRQTTADFLVSVTDPNGRIIREGYEHRVPRTADEFVQYYKNSEIAEINSRDIDLYKAEFVGKEHRASSYKQSYYNDHAKFTNPKSPYVISVPMQVKAVVLRRLQIMRNAYAVQVIMLLMFVLLAVIMGTVFFRLKDDTSTFYSRGGVLFFSILFAALTTMAEISSLFAQRPVVLRQSRAAMYHPFVESLSTTLVDVPKMAIILTFFSVVLYFLVDLRQDAAACFIFTLYVFSMTIILQALFRSMAAAAKSPAPAQTVGGFFTLVLIIYTGYTIPQPSMIGALRWISYINPLKYGFESMIVNEFHNFAAKCAGLIPQGPGYENVSIANQACATVGSIPGSAIVDGSLYAALSFDYSYSHLWRNFGIIWAFGIAFITSYLTLTEFNLGLASESSTVLFKRDSKTVKSQSTTSADEEKGHPDIGVAINKEQPRKLTDEFEGGVVQQSHDVFTWQHLNYTITLPDGETKQLLDDVSGFVAPGKLTALVGSSGAGKAIFIQTTLLNVLAQRVTMGVVSGDRLVNGHPLPVDFQAQTGYCQQMDTHLPTSTVREALLFSAKLRQPASVPLAEKEAYVDKCLKMCGLEQYADAVVGSLGVEHRKRTTIAVELAAKPQLLLFLDEPTSGLDSQSAWAITSFLRTLADNGQAILCTIHQPSAELFGIFDRLLLLRRGGQTVYFGDLGHQARTLINYFQRNGARECLPDENPAEYMLAVTGAGATARADIDWHEVWKKSPEAAQLQRELERIHADGRSRPPPNARYKSEFATSWCNQFALLLRREMEDHWRQPTYMISKLGLNIVSGIFIGFTFFKAKDTLQGTQNKLFAVFMGTIPSVAIAMQLQVPFIATRTIYEIRERPSRMYSWTALLCAQLLAELPWNILSSSLFFLCWYWTVAFPTSRAGYTFLMFGVVFPAYYTSIGQAIATMSPNAETAALLFCAVFSFVLIFNGVLQPYRGLGWWRWMYRTTPFTYLIEGLLGQAIGRSQINCSSLEFAPVHPPAGQTCQAYLGPFVEFAGGYIENPDSTDVCQYCPFRTTDQFLLSSFNINYDNRWRDFGLLLAYVAFNIFCMFAFTYVFRISSTNYVAWVTKKLSRRK